MVDLRGHETDRTQTHWPSRGYDDRGRPLCAYGYAFTANGFDPQRQRDKWCCAQACTRGAAPRIHLPDVIYPPPECPYQSPDHPFGQIRTIGETCPDGSTRLVRDVPVGSLRWHQLYHRGRNAVEGRHAFFTRARLKRLPVYGTPRGRAVDFLADAWLNRTTLARLCREATAATGH
jgi:hypothetical protein